MNDLQAARFILGAMEQPLMDQDQADLESHLANSPQTRQFADLVRRTEICVQDTLGIEQMDALGPGLSDVARARLQKELLRALIEKAPMSRDETGTQDRTDAGMVRQDRLVAEPDGNYQTGQTDGNDDVP